VEHFGGRLWVESLPVAASNQDGQEEASGSTFVFTLPLAGDDVLAV
jgi:signal transduction histidine kinase